MAMKDVLPRYLAGGSWKKHQFRVKGKASQTPGKKKNKDTCQLTPLFGLPRKFFCRSRAYKVAQYKSWCEKMDRLNVGSRVGEQS